MSALEQLFFKCVPASARRRIRDGSIAFVRRALIPPILSRRLELQPGPAGVSVHVLVSDSTWEMGMLAAKSFRKLTGCEWNMVIHDDGSVSPEHLARTRQILPGATVIPRAEADPAMESALAEFPICRENRRKHNWFLKVFDCHHFAPGDRYIVLDADVIFFKKPPEIMTWASGNDGSCWFNRDGKECYALPREEIEREWPLPIWERVNSGLCLLQKEALSLPRCEDFLKIFAEKARQFMFLEQTLIAVNGSAHGRGGLLPEQYEIRRGHFHRPDAVCRHYVGPIKHDIFFLDGVTTLFKRMFLSRSQPPVLASR